jgi:uncharacterized membrane protein YagU involved in acid resistance
MTLDWIGIVVWGFGASALMVLVEAAGLWLGWTRMSTPVILGAVFVGDRDRAACVGTIVHFVFGWAYALGYAVVFGATGTASWWMGLVLGVLHGVFLLGVVLPVMPAFHPRMASTRAGPEPSRALQAPGFLGLHYGRGTMLVSVVAHAVFGVAFGAMYAM